MTVVSIGYSLVEGNAEIASWTGLPTEIKLPSGEFVYCPEPGLLGAVDEEGAPVVKQYIFCERFLEDAGSPGQFHSSLEDTIIFDGQKVVVTKHYSSIEDIVPASVTPLQIRLALRSVGLKAQVDSYIATLSPDAQDKWEYATIVERHDPTLVAGTRALGMTSDQVDSLFRLASTLL